MLEKFKNEQMKAKDKKCVKCGKQAVAFYPVELDIPSFPYCRECLDKIKLSVLIDINKERHYE